jgi:RNA polymerase sigma-70 factor, ECF subfamily
LAILPSGLFGDEGIDSVALSEIDRNLLQRCLHRKPRAWEDFVDRFMGLIIHVVNHTAQARSVRLTPEDRDDLCAEVFMNLIRDDFAILCRFRGQSSLATYLTVVARRIVVRHILEQKTMARLGEPASQQLADSQRPAEQRIEDEEEISRLMEGLAGTEAQVVRMYHLEGRSYYEISVAVGVSENSIGPMLSRARGKMRQIRVNPTL